MPTLISLLADILVFLGVIILAGALILTRRLIARLPKGAVRNYWNVLAGFIWLFMIGYMAYGVVTFGSHVTLLDFIAPGVFFFGACFVLMNTFLSSQTAKVLQRISCLEQENITDSLTGLYNRRYLDFRLKEEIAIAQRYVRPLSVLLFDIDNFKKINDIHGHQAGDQVLSSLRDIIIETIRESDIAARYGGDEFLVIAPHTRIEDAAALAERLRECVASYQFTYSVGPIRQEVLHIEISVGVADICNEVNTHEKLILIVDNCLYCAKQEGRNRVFADIA